MNKPFTLGGLMKPRMPRTAKAPGVAKLPAARGVGATLKLLRLPLSKVKAGPGF